MKKRVFDALLRIVGNSYVITIPKKTVKRFKMKKGSKLKVSIEK